MIIYTDLLKGDFFESFSKGLEKNQKFFISSQNIARTKKSDQELEEYVSTEHAELEKWKNENSHPSNLNVKHNKENTLKTKMSFLEGDANPYVNTDKISSPNNYSNITHSLVKKDKEVIDFRNSNNINMQSTGLELLKLNSHVKIDFDKNIYECLKPHYLDIFTNLEKTFPAASKIILFSAVSRNITADSEDKGVNFAHSDFTCASGLEREKRLLQKQNLISSEQDFFFVNTWMHINKKSATSSLGFLLRDSIETKDLGILRVRSEKYDFSNYLLKDNPNHVWGRFSNLDTNELIAFKQFDSSAAKDYENHKNVTFHSAIKTSENTDVRSSMEIRFAIVF